MTHYLRLAVGRCASPLRVALTSFALLSAVLCGTAAASSLRFTPWVRAVAEVRGAVVNIHGQKTISAERESYDPGSQVRQVNGMGTGVVIDERGYIITNFHVIDGVKEIQVSLDDQRTLRAHMVSHDPKTDIAIIKIDAGEKLPVIRVGTSQDLMPAEPVIAVGNAYGYSHTITRGIISQLHRKVAVSDDQTYEDLIQTDASINPGNSGGPLLNIDGDMIGLNVAVRVGAQGIGFAIPVDDVMEVAAELMDAERVSNIWHGISGKTKFDNTTPFFVVESVAADSPAMTAGVQAGDVIREVDGTTISREIDFQRTLLGARGGATIPIRLVRDSREISTSITLVEPTDRTWQYFGMRLAPAPRAEFTRNNVPYRGGMKVVAVRAGGPADKTGIRQGDILVGMLGWETVSEDNVTYILNSAQFREGRSLKFFVVRSGETLYGHIRPAL